MLRPAGPQAFNSQNCCLLAKFFARAARARHRDRVQAALENCVACPSRIPPPHGGIHPSHLSDILWLPHPPRTRLWRVPAGDGLLAEPATVPWATHTSIVIHPSRGQVQGSAARLSAPAAQAGWMFAKPPPFCVVAIASSAQIACDLTQSSVKLGASNRNNKDVVSVNYTGIWPHFPAELSRPGRSRS